MEDRRVRWAVRDVETIVLYEGDQYPNRRGVEVLVPDELWERYQRAEAEWLAVQDEVQGLPSA